MGAPRLQRLVEADARASLETLDSLGAKVHGLRKLRRLTLAQLAERTSLSVGHLSQVERGLSEPSIRHLQMVASALGVKMHWFFDDEEPMPASERGVIVRANRRRRLDFSDLKITDYLLSPTLAGRFQLLWCELAPGARTDVYSHEGEEAGVVIAGQLHLELDGVPHVLGEGDSFAFQSSTPHQFHNPGVAVARVVWVVTTPAIA